MFQLRSHASLILCSAISAVLLTGCPNAGTQPPLAGASGSPDSQPSAGASTPAGEASQPPTGASVAPSATPSSGPARIATLRGKVYDESGATVTGAKVKIRSLSTATPFETTVDVTGGSYVANSVPAGAQIEITATKDGWTSRTRVESLLDSTGDTNIVNFGGVLNDQEDPESAPYFISDYPEVVSATATRTDSKLTYVVRLSEPLDTTNQRRFENAFSVAAPDGDGGIVTLRKGSTFLDDRVVAKMTWDTTGAILTYEFEAPLLARNSDETRYTLTLPRAEGDPLIEDASGHRLGFLDTPEGSTYARAFKLAAPGAPADNSAAARWTASHTGSASFTVPEDDTKPTLVSVSGNTIQSAGDKFRFTLTFSEPMQVYPGGTTGAAASTLVLSNYRFVLSEEDVAGVDMDATPGTVANATQAQAAMNDETVFTFDAAVATVALSTTDAKVVQVTVNRDLVPTDAKFVKVRVDNVQDPADNVIGTGNEVAADNTADNIKMGAI
jgi:hypothetical protein